MKLIKFILPLLLVSPLFAGEAKNSPSVGYKSAAMSAYGQPEYRDESINLGTRYKQVRLTTAQVLALNTTPILVVSSPGAGKALMPIAVHATMDYAAATYVTNSNETLDIEYGDTGSGDIAASVPVTFMEATADAIAYTPAISVVPVVNKPLYVHIGGGDPTTGDSDIYVRVYYKVVPSLLTK